MITMPMLFAACVFTAALTFTLVMVGASRSELKATFSKRLAGIQKTSADGSLASEPLSLRGKGTKSPGFDLESWIRKQAIGGKLDTLLLQSGSSIRMRRLLFASFGLAVFTGTVVTCTVGSRPLALAASMGAGAVPIAMLRHQRSRRLARFEASLPEAIALMARCLRAGHSIAAALEIIADQSHGPLASEFARVSQQQRLGIMFRESMIELAGRVPSQDLQFLVTAILVQRESGGDLTDILDGATRVISDRMRIAAQVRVHSAQGRLSGWILSALPFVMFLMINLLNPGYSRLLFSDPTGRLLLYGGLCSIGTGIFMIHKIVDVRV